MWPFTKKESKPDWCEEGIAKLKAFRDVGQTFNYLGRTCIVSRHCEWWPYAGCIPRLVCDYADDYGVIRQAVFRIDEIPALEAQNRSE